MRSLPNHAPAFGELRWELTKAPAEVVAGEYGWDLWNSPLLIWGGAGRGKSALAALLFQHWQGPVQGNSRPLWINAGPGLAAVSQAFRDSPQPYWGIPTAKYYGDPAEMWAGLREACFVVLDDIGARSRVSDAQYEALHRLLNERGAQPMVVTSNLDLAGLARVYDDRISSRLGAGTVWRLAGPDRRVEVK